MTINGFISIAVFTYIKLLLPLRMVQIKFHVRSSTCSQFTDKKSTKM